MNIFEQFGIKEVADVTIYAIDLDKYDDEIYIPIMYLDTLKVSTIEQTASQTSARGGLGNAELISWDFGKEISVSLQDALFTPASQSLMWGGRYGIRKPEIFGVWNPFIYPSNDRGEQIYVRKVSAERKKLDNILPAIYYSVGLVEYSSATNKKKWKLVLGYEPGPQALFNDTTWYFEIEEDSVIEGLKVKNISIEEDILDVYGGKMDVWKCVFEDNSQKYITPIKDDNHRQLKFFPNENNPIYPKLTVGETFSSRMWPGLGYTTFVCPCDSEVKTFMYVSETGSYKYIQFTEDVDRSQLTPSLDTCPAGGTLYDSEEAFLPIYKYTIASSGIKTSSAWFASKRPEIASLKIDKFGSFTYDTYSLVHTDEEPIKCFYESQDYCDHALIKCTSEVVDAYGYEWKDTSVIMNSFEGEQDSYYLDAVDIRYRIRSADNKTEVGIAYTNSSSSYEAKLDIYKDIVQKYTDVAGKEQELSMKVKVGTFYIIEDWNLSESTPQSLNNLIETGINNVDIFETMEKLQATRTFAIDADKNVRCSNYRYDPAYAKKALAVFINPRTMQPYEANASTYLTEDGLELKGNFTIIHQNEIYYKWQRQISDGLSSLGHQIIVDAKHFPGTYRIVGETLVRSRADGQDQRYQFEIPICKLSAETNITLEASGDPTTFSMNFKVLRKDDGTMMKLTQYGKPVNRVDEHTVPSWEDEEFKTRLGAFRATPLTKTFSVVNPTSITSQYTDADEDAPLDGSSTGHVNVADQAFLDANTTEEPVVYQDGDYSLELPSEKLSESAELDKNIDTVVVSEQTDWDIEREVVNVYSDGTEVPTGEWVHTDTATTNEFLNSDEYTIETEANSR